MKIVKKTGGETDLAKKRLKIQPVQILWNNKRHGGFGEQQEKDNSGQTIRKVL